MVAHDFQKFAARRYTQDDFDLLTDEEVEVLKRRRKHSPQSVALQLSMSVETVYRRQNSIRAKLDV